MTEKNEKNISIQIKEGIISGILTSVISPKGIVIFAHGSGSSRFSPRNTFVARKLQESHLSTLLLDLLTPNEEIADELTSKYRFNISLLSDRLVLATSWIENEPSLRDLSIGYLGASTGAAAALIAASKLKSQIKAVVSRGGRPDLAKEALKEVVAPTLLIIGGDDKEVIELNKEAYEKLKCTKKIEIIAGATHLFEEEGKLEKVAKISAKWFLKYLTYTAHDRKIGF
jgi:putative phosphoribosyl transferase